MARGRCCIDRKDPPILSCRRSLRVLGLSNTAAWRRSAFDLRGISVEDCEMPLDRSDLTLPEIDRQELIGWTTACVRRLLSLFESAAPSDRRLADALEGATGFAQGDVGVGLMRKLAFGCHAAARDVDDPAASAMARACGQAVAVAHMAGHSREISRYTKKALGAEAATELEWQRDQIPPRFEEYVYSPA